VHWVVAGLILGLFDHTGLILGLLDVSVAWY
jgi:hypothetical protein